MTEQLIGWTLDVTFMWQPEKNQCFTSQHPARQRDAHRAPTADGDHLFLWHMIAAAAQIMSFHLPLVVLSLSGLVFVRAGLCCCDFLLWKEKKSNTKQKNNTAAKHRNYDSLMTPCICFVLFVVCFNRFSHFAQKIKSWVLCLSRA